MTALGLAAGGASKTIQEGLDREQKKKDREARSAEAAAGRQHTTDLLYKRRRFEKSLNKYLRKFNLKELGGKFDWK